MKKLIRTILCSIVAAIFCFSFAACSILGGDDSTSTEATTYTIQYTDDNGTHRVEVKNGDLYSIESIPERTGYTFLGLYDAETGGTQYVNSSGSSVSAFTDKQNIVLYPQYSAKEYTVVLDYGEAAVTGSRQYTVTYGESMPTLPTNLTVTHKVFSGWYTEENCGGTKVADGYGLIPVVSVVNSDNFEITNNTTYLYLYAGFTAETYTVTLNYGTEIKSETIEVEYGTNISDIVTSTRDSNGYAVISWGLSYSGSEYTGTITEEIVLYALEWAPCITFNSNGGDSVTTIVARASTAISLPTASRQSYKFMYWADSEGNESTLTSMPSSSITLTAVWQAMIVFDENGGSEVSDISEVSGTTITLPTPEKDGYIFAGWYTNDKTQYTSTKMPSSSVELKAGWYSELTDTVVEISSTTSDSSSDRKKPSTSYLCYTFNYSKYFTDDNSYQVNIEWHVKIKTNFSTASSAYADFYSQKTISSTYLIGTQTFSNIADTYKAFDFNTSITVNDNFYVCFYGDGVDSVFTFKLYISDFYYTVHYPDTTTLYL